MNGQPTTPELARMRDRIQAWLADETTPPEQRPGLEHALFMVDQALADRLVALVFVDDGVSFGDAVCATARDVGIERAPAPRPIPIRRAVGTFSTAPAPAPVAAVRGRRPPLGSGVRHAGR